MGIAQTWTPKLYPPRIFLAKIVRVLAEYSESKLRDTGYPILTAVALDTQPLFSITCHGLLQRFQHILPNE